VKWHARKSPAEKSGLFPVSQGVFCLLCLLYCSQGKNAGGDTYHQTSPRTSKGSRVMGLQTKDPKVLSEGGEVRCLYGS
jgi:hypothetical protein